MALSVCGGADVKAAYARILDSAGRYTGQTNLDTVMVQKMMPPGREPIVGGLIDPDLGPMILLGFGRIYVELLRDTTLALAPLSLDDAHAMIR